MLTLVFSPYDGVFHVHFSCFSCSGILTADECGTEVNHCVQIVGVDFSDSKNPYWIVRNSWGTSWGLKGYIHIEAGTDACLITTDPTYVLPVAVSKSGTSMHTSRPTVVKPKANPL